MTDKNRPFFWGVDPASGKDIPIFYDELEKETKKSAIKPIGGFIFPASKFMLLDLPTVPFYVKDILPKRGKAMLYAAPKSGKSWLALQLARCIGTGEPFLGLSTTQGKVLYVQFELGEEILQARLLDSKEEYEDVWVGTTFTMKLDTKAGQDRLWRAMEAVEPNILILDPWYKMLSGDENEASDALEIIDYLDSLIEGFDCSIFIVHHSGKDVSKRGRGSSVLEDWVDSYIQMTVASKAGEKLQVKIRPIFFRHAPLWDEPIFAEMQDNFEFIGVGRALTIKQQVEKFVLDHATQKNPVEVKQIFDANLGSNTSIYKALRKLVEEGKIEKKEWGKYRQINKRS
jgi:hypothetical protein